MTSKHRSPFAAVLAIGIAFTVAVTALVCTNGPPAIEPDAGVAKAPVHYGASGPPIPGPGDAGTVLTSNGPGFAVSWQSIGGVGGLSLPDGGIGAIWYETADGGVAPLPIGASGQQLDVVAGLPSWVDAAVPLPDGGTGAIWYETIDAAAGALPIGTTGQQLVVSTSGLPSWVSAGWITAMDCDLTAQGSATYATDTTYTLCGYTVTKSNSANESVHSAISGSGLNFQPSSSTDYNVGKNSPSLAWDLVNVIPNYDQSVGVRAWAYISSQNYTGTYDNSILSIDTNENATTFGFAYKRGVGTLGNGSQTFFEYNNANSSGFQRNAYTIGVANNVNVLEVLRAGWSWYTSYHGQYSSGWPAVTSLQGELIYYPSGGSGINYALLAQKTLKVGLGAARGGSATALSVTFGRVRIDYKF